MFDLSRIQQDYCSFMGIQSLPSFELCQEIIQKGTKRCYIARARYDFEKAKLILEIPSGYEIPISVLFHEFTHLYDYSLYVIGSGMLPGDEEMRAIDLTVYTEYHASQVEILQLLGANSVQAPPKFSLEQTITIGKLSFKVYEYWLGRLDKALLILNSQEYNNDEVKRIIQTLTLLGNYWGIRSIVEKYATDYSDDYKKRNGYNSILHHFDPLAFVELDELMHGRLTSNEINRSIYLCSDIIRKATGMLI